MKNIYSFRYIKIDMSIFRSSDDFRKLFDDNNISLSRISVEKVVKMKSICDYIFLDPITFRIVAYLRKGSISIEFVDDISKYLIDYPSLSYTKEYDFSNLSIDGILDKISSDGISSLSIEEKLFLEKMSKK